MDRIQHLFFEHRRTLAAILAGLAVLAFLGALRQGPEQAPVLTVSRDLPSGHVITAADIRTQTLPTAAIAGHTLSRQAVLGARLAGPMRQGEQITDARVLDAGSLSGYGDDAVLTTIRVDRADGASGVRVGEHVDVIAVNPDGQSKAQVVARDVEVVMVGSGDDAGALSVVTDEERALDLATAGLTSRFSIIRSRI